MSKQTRVGHLKNTLLPTEVEGVDSLAELALDMRSSWNHATDEVWRNLDSELWDITHNPWAVLQTVSRDQIQHVLADPIFRNKVDGLVQTRRQAVEAPAWFQQQVELYAEATKHAQPTRQVMTCERHIQGASGSYSYSTAVSASRAAADYTARVIPYGNGLAIPLEDSRIRWQP